MVEGHASREYREDTLGGIFVGNQTSRAPPHRGYHLLITTTFWRATRLLLLVQAVVGLNPPQQVPSIRQQQAQFGSAKRVLSLFAKLKEPPSRDMMGKRDRTEEDGVPGGDVTRRRKAGGLEDDPDSDDRETDEEEEEEEEEESSDDGDEEEFTLDEFGRIPGGMPNSSCYPDLNYDYRCFPSFLEPSADDLEQLISDCRLTFTARTTRKGQKYSAGETYWLAANTEPRCALEKLAKDVFDLHTKGKVAGEDFNALNSGAEWWTLVLDADDDVGLHWDRDYDMEASTDILVHPHLSTVTYLTNVGGPTVVLGCVSPMESDALGAIVGPINEAFISRPAAGKHISFDGRLLHGAPADADIWKNSALADVRKGSRVTFLVNVWLNHAPSSAEPLPADKAAQLATTSVCLRQSSSEPAELEATSLDMAAQSDSNKILDMRFIAPTPVVLRFPLPVNHLQGVAAGSESAAVEGGSWLLKYPVTDSPDGPQGPCCISAST